MSSANNKSNFPSDENHNPLTMIKDHVMQAVLANQWLHGPQQAHHLEWLRENKEQTDTVLDLCLSDAQYSEYSLQLGTAIWRFWLREGDYAKGHDKLAKILAHGSGKEASLWRALCLEGQGALAKELDMWNEAESCYQEMLEIGHILSSQKEHSRNDQHIIASAKLGLGDIECRASKFDAAYSLLSESYQIFEGLNDTQGIIKARKGMGIVELMRNHYREATELLQMSLNLGHKSSNDHLIADCLNDLGNVALAQEFHVAAREFYEESLSIIEDLKDQSREASLLNNLSALCLQLLDFRKGLNYAIRSAELYKDLGKPQHQAYALMNAAESEMELENYSTARQTLKESFHIISLFPDRIDWYGIVNILQVAGLIANKTHKLKDAAKFFGIAAGLRLSLNSDIHPAQKEKLDENYQMLRSGLGSEAFDEAWEEGISLARGKIVLQTLQMLAA